MSQAHSDSTRHTTKHLMHPRMPDAIVTSTFYRWQYSGTRYWTVIQHEASNAFGPNEFRAVVDDFGTLVPVLQMAGFIANDRGTGIERARRAYVN